MCQNSPRKEPLADRWGRCLLTYLGHPSISTGPGPVRGREFRLGVGTAKHMSCLCFGCDSSPSSPIHIPPTPLHTHTPLFLIMRIRSKCS